MGMWGSVEGEFIVVYSIKSKSKCVVWPISQINYEINGINSPLGKQ